MTWKPTISYAALKKAGSAAVRIRDKIIFIAVVDGELYAIDGICPHARCVITELDKENLRARCRCHNAVFDLRTGEMLEPPYVAPDIPKERMKLKVYNVRVNKGFVEVDVSV